MDDQTFIFEKSRAVGITTQRKVSRVLLSSLTFIDTDINGLRRYVLLTAFLAEKRECSNKNAMNPSEIPAFPRTFKDLQVADGYLRLKWAHQAAETDGTEYHREDRDACAHCHGPFHLSDPSTADDNIPIVENSCLSRGNGALRLIKGNHHFVSR
jgi:hypothetical protein